MRRTSGTDASICRRRGPRDHPPTQPVIQDCSDRRPRAPCCPEESERGAAHPHRKEPDEQGQGLELDPIWFSVV